ncbi:MULTISPECIES: cytochrome P450 [unclassified Streptomyces]|uniref:cytochrome P450 n=1 Tax=unclassified Streptomyces TaxID=2593676 RepID=UPI003825057B
MTDMVGIDTENPLPYPLKPPTALTPPTEWEALRRECPVAHVTFPSGDGARLLTRYEDVRTALSDPRFSRSGLSSPDAARVSAGGSDDIFNSPMARTLHSVGQARWRSMVARYFTAKRMAALRPDMQAATGQLIDAMTDGKNTANLVPELAFPLPVYIICQMLGVPEADRDRFKVWSDAFLNTTRFTREEMDAAYQDFAGYMAGLVAEKKAAPGQDLISVLLTGDDGAGEPMAEDALVATGQALLLAGHETTAGYLALMVAHLLSDRGRWEQLLADRSLIRHAVEESLRFDPNGASFGMLRYAHEDTELSGTVVPAGTTVVCSMASANRDEDAWQNAADMDLTRSPNPHLAFGAGPHSCLGQQLARTEMQTVLGVLLDRLPTLRLAVEPDQLLSQEGLLTAPLQGLPVTW